MNQLLQRRQRPLRRFNPVPALLLALTMVLPFCGAAEETNKIVGERSKFPCPENEIARYTAHRVSGPITIDGRLDEPAWTNPPWSPRFHDTLTGARAFHDTRACVLWGVWDSHIPECFPFIRFSTNGVATGKH